MGVPVCGPEWSAEQICSTPLRSVSFAQLSAVHVMSLDDDGLRYFFPRLVELLLVEPSPWFDFRLSDLKGRLPAWRPAERAVVRQFVVAVWRGRLRTYPPSQSYLGAFESDIKATVLSWLGQPAIGERLQDAFFAADGEEAASQLSAAYELWALCIRG
jgi:hypothetical protein